MTGIPMSVLEVLIAAVSLGGRARSFVRKRVDRLDPNDDPDAEPVSIPALIVLVMLTAFSTYLFLRWKIQPMQDVGHHLAMTAVVADYGHPGSLYPAIYKPFDWLNTNSLLYTVAGFPGRLVSPSWMFRLAMASYVAGVPLTSLWAVRVFGRSAWGAVITVPLVYNMSYVFGFANFLFAAPFAIIAIPLFYRILVKPTRGRVIASTIAVTLVFLAHVHVFLWTGILLFGMTLAFFIGSVRRKITGRPGASPIDLALWSLVSVTPSLILFGRWMYRATRPAPADEYVTYLVGSTTWASFVGALKTSNQLLLDLPVYLDLVKTDQDHTFFLTLAVVGAIAMAIARMHRWNRPPVLELVAAITLGSYFFLPENAAGQAVIGSRQIGFGLWLAAASFSPVPARVTRLGRWFVIVAIVVLSTSQLVWWRKNLIVFEKTEAIGLEEVLAAAPPRLRMHYVNISPESKVFALNSFWHVEKWYMLDKAGQCNENPAYGAMNSIHYRAGFEPHRVVHHANDWPAIDEIWESFDLVLTHHWHPTAHDLAVAQQKGDLLAKSGEWELWRSRRVPR